MIEDIFEDFMLKIFSILRRVALLLDSLEQTR